MAYASVNDLEELKRNPDYLKYWELKQAIKSKYPEDCFPNYTEGPGYCTKRGTKEQHQLYREYLKEISDLLFQPEGYYQKFVWNELIPPGERESMERKARGRLPRIVEY